MQPYQITDLPSHDLSLQRNRVLRNTYMLLALTMIPTVIGSMIGVQTGFNAAALIPGSPMISLFAFIGVLFGLMWGIRRTQESAMGVVLLLVFTFVMGLMLSGILSAALGFSNGGNLIAMAATGTGAIFFTMAGIATVSKRDFSFLGKFLFIGLVMVVLASLANMFFNIPLLGVVVSGVVIVLFSLYILHDISRIVNGGETNYISATLSVYLNIYNIFVHLLHLLMVFSGNRD